MLRPRKWQHNGETGARWGRVFGLCACLALAVLLLPACSAKGAPPMNRPTPARPAEEPVEQQALAALKAGDLAAARQYAGRLLATPAGAATGTYLLGLVAQQAGDHAEAVKQFSAAITAQPDCAECYNNRGLSFQELGDMAQAEADLRKALALDETLGDAHYNLGVLRYLLHEYADAAGHLKRATELNSQDRNAWLQLALARQRQGQTDEAIAALDRSIELGHGFSDQAYSLRGQLYAQQGDFARAEADFDAAIRRGLRNADTLFYRGLMRYYQGRLQEARDDLLVVVEQFAPDYVEAHYQLAYIYARLGDDEKARSHAQKALDLDPPQDATTPN